MKTLSCLHEGGVSSRQVYVFVVKEQEEEYRKIPRELYHKIVVGVKGLVNQRQFINDYFKKGQLIVCMDDDIQALKYLYHTEADKSKNKIRTVDDMPSFFDMAFSVMKQRGANIWGMTAVANPFYMNDTITTNLKYIIGAFYGIRNTKDPNLVLRFGDNQEDKERTIRYFDRDGVVVRFNQYAPVTAYYAPGGMDTPTRRAETKKFTELLVKEYPQYVYQIYKEKKGIYDLRFRRVNN